jgi:hypothetical protein
MPGANCGRANHRCLDFDFLVVVFFGFVFVTFFAFDGMRDDTPRVIVL